ncbi:COG1361 family protein [Nocardioides terrisoli]|uniref:hypothetical protein n=1 Tax=Nocardioides terrisoli TaxID=3388267 RepID=UPI00287B9137|nr:hypothetical protein [Nocardioides marmorisolisilvae]
MEKTTKAAGKRRRKAPLLWAGGALGAAILVLGVNGTLSSWTSAIINNDHNSVASAKAVALVETGTQSDGTAVTTQCDTASVADGTNTVTCSQLNKYGGVTGGTSELGTAATDNITALSPGDTRDSAVTLTNDGTGTGNLTLAAGSCGHVVNDAAGGDTTGNYDLCTQITVSVACTGDATLAATTPVTLSNFNGSGFGSLSLAPGKSSACTFTVALPADTPAGFSNQLASQALTWTLAAA